MSEYDIQAEEFATKYGVKLTFIGEPEFRKHFDDDKEERWVFKCRLSRNGKSYTFPFGQSLISGCEEPTMYDILACLQKYEIGDFEDFCACFGYDTDSRRAERTWKACKKEWQAVERLFGDVLEELQEIQ